MPLSTSTSLLRITLLYLMFAGLWILASDIAVRWAFPDPGQYGVAQTIKGLAFILGTTLLIHGLLSRELGRRFNSEQALARAQARLERAEQASHVMASHVDLNARWKRLPPGLCDLLGFTEQELLDRTVTEITHPEDRANDRDQALKLVRGEIDSYEVEKRYLRKSGGHAWVYVNGSIVRDEAGKPLYFLGYIRDITQRKEAEIARDRLADILEATPDFVGTATPEGRTLYVNRAGRRMVERAPDRRVEDMQVADFHPGWARRKVTEEGIPAAMERGSWEGETALLAGDGREIPISQVILAHRDAEGRVLYLSTIARDITERIRAERELRESQERSVILAKATNDAIWDWNLLDNTVKWNEGVTTLFGYSPDQVGPAADWWIEHIHPDDRDAVDRDIHAVMERGDQFWSSEYRYLKADGSTAYVFDRGYVMYGDGGEPVRMIGAMMDLSQRVRAELELRESREWLQLAVSSASIGLWDWDTRTHEVYYSREWKAQLGYDADDISDRFEEWERLLHPDDVKPALSRVREYLEDPSTPYANEFRMRCKDGSYRWILANARLIADETGQPTRMVGSHVDITEHKAEEERTLGIARAVSGAPGEGFFEYLAEQAAKALGADCALIGELDTPGGRRIRTRAMLTDGRPQPPLEYELEGTPCEGVLRQEICVHASGVQARFPRDRMLAELAAEGYVGVPLRDGEGRTRGIFVLLYREPLRLPGVIESALRIFAVRAGSELQRLDYENARRDLEERVRHAQKLESLGVLAGGIAHDFNNLLLTIMGNAGLAQMDAGERPALKAYLSDIEQASQRAADLCRQLLAYSGKGKFIVDLIDLNDVAREMSNLLGISISKKAELNLDLASELPPVEGDPTQIRQVLMNLITNASDALEDAPGRILVTSGARECDGEFLSGCIHDDELAAGLYAWLEVADTGCGMDEATLERMFDPFFTTKFAGRGLGMAAVRGIIRSHRGAIRIQSRVGQGTRFLVLLPAAAGRKATASERPTPAGSGWKGSGPVLVVDDEAPVRDFARRALELAGFEVHLAVDGAEAVDQVRRNAGTFRLVLLDLTMPRLSGEQVCAEIRKLDARLPILLTSGYSETETVRGLLDRGAMGFIQKPYRPSELIERVRGLIGNEERGPASGDRGAPPESSRG